MEPILPHSSKPVMWKCVCFQETAIMIHKTGAPMTSLPSPWALSHTLWQVYSNRLWRASNNIQTVASSLTTHQDMNELRYWEEQNTFFPYWQLPNLPGKHKISRNNFRNKFHELWESKNFFSWDCFTNMKIRSGKFPCATPLSSHPPSTCPIPPSPPFSLLERASSSAALSCRCTNKTNKTGLKLAFSGPKSLPGGKASLPVWMHIPF